MPISMLLALVAFVCVSLVTSSENRIVDLSVLQEKYSSRQINKNHVSVNNTLNITIPYEYPIFKNCGNLWGSDIMVTKTICQVGCLMSSTSMGLSFYDIKLPRINGISNGISIWPTPGTLNTWLQQNGGYDDDDDFIEPVLVNADPSRISWPADAMHKTNDLSYSTGTLRYRLCFIRAYTYILNTQTHILTNFLPTVAAYIEAGRVVIGNVMDGGHFVLLTGYSDDGDTFAVNDPGFDTPTYSYSNDIVGYRIFDMTR